MCVGQVRLPAGAQVLGRSCWDERVWGLMWVGLGRGDGSPSHHHYHHHQVYDQLYGWGLSADGGEMYDHLYRMYRGFLAQAH